VYFRNITGKGKFYHYTEFKDENNENKERKNRKVSKPSTGIPKGDFPEGLFGQEQGDGVEGKMP
jgi:hypothetical protein